MDRVHVGSLSAIDFLSASCGNGIQTFFALQGVSFWTIGPIELQYEVYPLLEQGWATVPIKRMVPNNDVVVVQNFFFLFHIDQKIWIVFVQIVEGYSRNILDLIYKGLVGLGSLELWVCE